ncbi:MAG: 4Fe-4S dicluster domain-containing protein [Phycisphaerae bacterium]|nr:4Fe-4S dicluster domain-containing protein [Phycisphaerae bacterium]
MKYGFLIDHDRCIGCHACTVACKAENNVPVGDFRTWVKYVEKGAFPEVRRHFAVLRCNHCSNAPCVTICPVNALEKRADGIVDIDRDACIGCRACMQACPYDAIYLNQDSGAVEKCHFCAHRVEKGLEPACVIVCPEQAIIAGDLQNPKAKIAQMLVQCETIVRRPEQRTGPNVYYKGVEPAGLDPGGPERPSSYLWSQRPPHKPEPWPISLPVLPNTRVVLDTGHKVEWGWTVALYLVTKAIGAGAGILAPFAAWLGLTGWNAAYLPEVLALVFTAITAAILIEDLARPARFYRLLTRPNWKSWLVKGGIILTIYAALAAAGIAARFLDAGHLAELLRWPLAALGLATAGYTALLFAQCEGRDLWQSKWCLPHLLVQASMVGGTAFAAAGASPAKAAIVVGASAVMHIVIGCLERFGTHETSNARQAAAFLGTLRVDATPAWMSAWTLSMLLVVLGAGVVFFGAWAGLALVLAGLFVYEWTFVRAGQLPPLS